MVTELRGIDVETVKVENDPIGHCEILRKNWAELNTGLVSAADGTVNNW
ncbi:MAG: hypothetical protein ACC742_12440 [Thermoanaerobaculales bacterium]